MPPVSFEHLVGVLVVGWLQGLILCQEGIGFPFPFRFPFWLNRLRRDLVRHPIGKLGRAIITQDVDFADDYHIVRWGAAWASMEAMVAWGFLG